jgi:2-keto-4-pentenoate hydratase/2-oxohepta-3-ene-1,7-dioic acid hydratase in catechol pathway
MSSEVLTTDHSVDDVSWLTGSVHVDGYLWATGRADDFAHTLPECLARLREGETVWAGEMLSTGPLAGCSGVETGRLPPPEPKSRSRSNRSDACPTT